MHDLVITDLILFIPMQSFELVSILLIRLIRQMSKLHFPENSSRPKDRIFMDNLRYHSFLVVLTNNN